MFKRHICLYIFIILILSNTALFAEDLVVPVIKAPYAINDAQFDSTGDYFAYEVNGKVYIRDSLSLTLKDSYQKNNKSDISAFYNSPDRADYPKAKVIANGNTLIIQSQQSASAPIDTKEITNLPARAKSAAINKSRTHAAFLGDDGYAYVYEIATNNNISHIPYNVSSTGISFTKDNKLIFSDSSKTAGIYNLSGQKIKTFTTANSIKGINLSPDEETVIIYDSTGITNLYNTNSSTQIGYIPNLGSKLIKNVNLSKDSRRIMITGENNALYVLAVQDILFSQNTVAPTPRQFAINYNAQDPNDKTGSGITEFGIKEFQAPVEDVDAEYILSTREKNLGKQNFELEEEHKAGETIVLSTQPEQAYFPPSIVEKDREVLFAERNNEKNETEVLVQEFTPPKEYTIPVPITEPDKTIVTTTPKIAKVYPPVQSVTITDGKSDKNDSQTYTPSNGNGPGNINIVINGNGNTEEELSSKEKKELEKNEKKAEKKKKDDNNKELESPIEKKLKEKLTEEDIKSLFKDGHGMLFNVGLYKLNDPFLLGVSFVTGYRNYDLLKPFYFGGTLEPFIGFANNTYPYQYKREGELSKNPSLLGLKVYVPFGFCIYPLKNSFELYTELGAGVSFTAIWNGYLPPNSTISSFFPAFYGNLKVGVAWDFINFSVTGSYDAIFGFNLGIDLGVIINLGGSRKIGSITFR